MSDERPSKIEEFFLKRLSLEVWQCFLLLLIAIIGLVGFGALVEYGATHNGKPPVVSQIPLKIARIPADARKVLQATTEKHGRIQAPHDRAFGPPGFTRFRDGVENALILSRYDGDLSRSVVEIIDLRDGTVLHRYMPDITALNKRSKVKSAFRDLKRDRDPQHYPLIHPFLTKDGDLIFNGMITPLAKIDVCSNIAWTIDGLFHHAIERDENGDYWTASNLVPPSLPMMSNRHRDDAIAKFNVDGEMLLERSVSQIFIDNNMGALLYTGNGYDPDPLHVNDVQPVLDDGPHWKKGDVFVSLRHKSVVLLYRPSTNKVIWWRMGPWMMQHDIDIISDHEIAIYNNNAANKPEGEAVIGVNETLVYDFTTDAVSSPYESGFEKNDIRTITEGLSEVLEDGEIVAEETNYGRLLKMDSAGNITWQFINRASDSELYFLQWSRIIDLETALAAAEKAREQC